MALLLHVAMITKKSYIKTMLQYFQRLQRNKDDYDEELLGRVLDRVTGSPLSKLHKNLIVFGNYVWIYYKFIVHYHQDGSQWWITWCWNASYLFILAIYLAAGGASDVTAVLNKYRRILEQQKKSE